MKKLLLIFCALFAYQLSHAQAQTLPYIATPTVIPQNPSPVDIVKIVTHVYTPNLGIIVDSPTFSVSQNPKEIKIRGCYWQGMATAIQDYIDTLVIGQLQAGVYTINHKAYLSTTQQHCSAIDSTIVFTTFTVATLTALKEFEKNEKVSVLPVPANEVLYLKNASGYSRADVYSYNGSLLQTMKPEDTFELDIRDLAPGLYFINFSGPQKNTFTRFIKE